MRKAVTFALVLAVAMMFASAGAYACGGEKSAENASAKSACSSSKTTEAKMISADKGSCASKASATTASADKAACASKTGEAKMTAAGHPENCASAKFMAGCDPSFCTPEDCAAWGKMCEAHGENAQIRMMSVRGMTCGGCENSIKTALVATPGVLEVAKVDYKRGVAVVIVDKTQAQNEVLTTTVTNKGYEAQMVQAVAKETTEVGAAKTSGSKLSCAATCAKPCDKAKASETKADEKSTSTPH